MSNLTIAITLAEGGNEAYATLLKAYEDPTMAELCTAVAYGDKNEALKQRKEHEIQTNFLSIQQTKEAGEGRLNLRQFPSPGEGTTQEATSMQAALNDEEADAVVDCTTASRQPLPMEVWLTEDVRLFVCESINVDTLVAAAHVLERDYGCLSPRIAILGMEQEMAGDVISKIQDICIATYGSYDAKDFIDEGMHLYFDGLIIARGQQAEDTIASLCKEYAVRHACNESKIVTAPFQPPIHADDTDVANLRHAVYQAMDTAVCRADYDTARTNPLQKLFHDKRDDRRHNNIE